MKAAVVIVLFALSFAAFLGMSEYHWKWASHKGVSIDSKAYEKSFSSEILKEFVLLWPVEDQSSMSFTRYTSSGIQEYVIFNSTLSLAEADNRVLQFLSKQKLSILDGFDTTNSIGCISYEYQPVFDANQMGVIILEETNGFTRINFMKY